MLTVKLSPAFKDYIWGGTKLRDQYLKKCDLKRVAESWELSTHPDGQSIIASGGDTGMSFSDYIKKHGEDILGENCKKFEDFPVLIKFIDAQSALSVQVHPDDEYALANEGEYGKTEMWYVMDCTDNAYLYFGLNCEISKEDFKEKIQNNTVTDVLNKVSVKKGDVFFIKAGTIHAIGAGILICEIQQNSNTTYRVYDYDRKDDKGNNRPLHIEKAIAVSDLKPASNDDKVYEEEKTNDATSKILANCKYFNTTKFTVKTKLSLNIDKTSFASIIILEGSGCIKTAEGDLNFNRADSIFIPANSGKIEIDGNCSFILTRV